VSCLLRQLLMAKSGTLPGCKEQIWQIKVKRANQANQAKRNKKMSAKEVVIKEKKPEENLPTEIETDVVPVLTDEEQFLQEQAEAAVPIGYPGEIEVKQKGDHAGTMWCEDTQLERESVTFVVLKIAHSRAMWPHPYVKGQKPLCRSCDAVSPDKDIMDENDDHVEPMCDTCEVLPGTRQKHKCPYANWSGPKHNVKPECSISTDLFVVDLDDFEGYWMSFASTRLKPLKKQLLIPLEKRAKGLTRQRKTEGLPGMGHPCMFKCTIKAIPNPDADDAYLPEFYDLEELPEDMKMAMVHAAMEAKDFVKRQSWEAEEETEGDDDGAEDQAF